MFIKINDFYYNEAIIASFGPFVGDGPAIKFNFVDGSHAAVEYPLSKYNGSIIEAEKARDARLRRLYEKMCK